MPSLLLLSGGRSEISPINLVVEFFAADLTIGCFLDRRTLLGRYAARFPVRYDVRVNANSFRKRCSAAGYCDGSVECFHGFSLQAGIDEPIVNTALAFVKRYVFPTFTSCGIGSHDGNRRKQDPMGTH